MKLFPLIASHVSLNVVIQILNLLTSVAVISLLPFSEMGIFAIAMVVAGVFGLFATLRIEWIVLNTKGARQARFATNCGLLVALLVAPVAFFVMSLFASMGILNFEKTTLPLIALAAVFTFTFACQRMLLTYHLSTHPVRKNLQARLFHAVVRLIATTLVCFLYGLAPAILMGEIAASISVILLINNWHEFSKLFASARIKFAWLLKHHRNILFFATPSAILGNLGTTLAPTIVISVSGLDAGGLVYTVQRIAGAPVKFALTTVGEVWHKLVQAGNSIAVKIGKSPGLLMAGMITIWLSMFVGVVVLLQLATWWFEPVMGDKLSKTLQAIDSYKIYICTTLAVNIFNRVIVYRNAVHKKLVGDFLYVCAPLLLLWLVPLYGYDAYGTIWMLALLQAVTYVYTAGLILYESRQWQKTK